LSTLGAQIWFFPLEYMDITGYELSVVCVFSPALLFFSRLSRFAQSQSLHIAAALGLAIAVQLQLLLPRMLLLALSTAASLLCLSARWSFSGLWLGFSGALVALDRLFSFSRPSFWAWPQIALALLCFTVALSYFNDRSSEPASARPFSWIVSLSLGSLLFLLQWLLLQSSALARLFGLPVMPLTLLIFVASLAGFSLPPPRAPLLRLLLSSAPPALLAAALVRPSALVLCLFAFSLASLWRPCAALAAGRPVAATLGTAVLVWLLHFLASVWTVAYNFVPFGGALLREQTHVHLLVASVLVCLTSLVVRPAVKSTKTGMTNQQALVVGVVILVLFAPVAVFRLNSHLGVELRAAQRARRDSGEIRSMIWAVHFGYDNFGRNSFDQIEAIIRSNKVNVIGLLESDLTRPFTDNWDVVRFCLVLFCLVVF
jgi:hypothetical protein